MYRPRTRSSWTLFSDFNIIYWQKVSVVIELCTTLTFSKCHCLCLFPFTPYGAWVPGNCKCVARLWCLIVHASLQLFLGRPWFLFPCGFYLSACLLTLLIGFHRVCPILAHLHLLIWMLIHSCSVLSHKASICLWWTVRICSQKTAIWRLLLLLSTSLKKVAGGNYNIARALSHHDSGSHSYMYLGEWCAPPGKFWNSGCLEDYSVAFFAPITDFSEDSLTPIYKG